MTRIPLDMTGNDLSSTLVGHIDANFKDLYAGGVYGPTGPTGTAGVAGPTGPTGAGGGGGTSSESITSSNLVPTNCDPNVAVTYVTSDGSGLNQHVLLPLLPLDANSVNIPKIGTIHIVALTTQTNGSDIVNVFAPTDNASVSGIKMGEQIVGESTNSSGVICDYLGAYAVFRWTGSAWMWEDDGNNDAVVTDIFVGKQDNPVGAPNSPVTITAAQLAAMTVGLTFVNGVLAAWS